MINKYKPLESLYVPSGWFISKNHLFDVDPSILLDIPCEQERFWTKDLFFYEDIFLGKHERTLPFEPLTAVVSVSCHLIDTVKIIYSVDFSIFSKKSKKVISIYRDEYFKTNDRFEVTKKVSDYMRLYSHYILPKFDDNTLNAKSDLNKFIGDLKFS